MNVEMSHLLVARDWNPFKATAANKTKGRDNVRRQTSCVMRQTPSSAANVTKIVTVPESMLPRRATTNDVLFVSISPRTLFGWFLVT